VHFETGVQVTDLQLAPRHDGLQVVRRIDCLRRGEADGIALGADDLVIATLGSMTADARRGSMDSPPPAEAGPEDGSWALWKRLAAKGSAFGRPWTFCGQVAQTEWITFTVTEAGERFAALMQAFSGSPTGRGGLVTLKSSAWGLTFHLYHPPAFAGQPPGTSVWWGYGLRSDRPGDHVHKTMPECSGREILSEVFWHLGLQAHAPELLAASNCIPCRLPYTTSQFMPRAPGDRPAVTPAGTAQLALVGQYCELPADVVYTVEYSVHAARQAVVSLLGLSPPLPRTYEGLEHPNALVEALRRVLQ
jgi:oleate hydratase